jgi:hypothetical protein
MKTRERLAYMVLGGLLGWHEYWGSLFLVWYRLRMEHRMLLLRR